jgi:methylated-DNA-protein-cysteine methyltransferase-like protein
MSADAREHVILAAIREIPEGFVRTYGDVSPGAPRLAGRVLAATTDGDLPWWRVVRADGSLAVGETQRERLRHEGVPFCESARPRVDLRVARIPAGLVLLPGSETSPAEQAAARTRA